MEGDDKWKLSKKGWSRSGRNYYYGDASGASTSAGGGTSGGLSRSYSASVTATRDGASNSSSREQQQQQQEEQETVTPCPVGATSLAFEHNDLGFSPTSETGGGSDHLIRRSHTHSPGRSFELIGVGCLPASEPDALPSVVRAWARHGSGRWRPRVVTETRRRLSKKCVEAVKEHRALFYIVRRCVSMLVCWRDR